MPVDLLNIEGLKALELDAPVVMLNLMRFRERSLDGDGSGWDAYLRYSALTVPMIKARGGTLLWTGNAKAIALGEPAGQPWDYLALVYYPTVAAFIDMMTSADYETRCDPHRRNGCAEHVIIATKEAYSKFKVGIALGLHASHRVGAHSSDPLAPRDDVRLELPHQVRRDFCDAADAEQRQVAVDLVVQQRDRALDAGFAGGDRRIEERPADQDEMRAERERLEHVGAAADAAVEHHGHAVRLRRRSRAACAGRDRVIELAAAMVGDHHAVDAALARDARILRARSGP